MIGHQASKFRINIEKVRDLEEWIVVEYQRTRRNILHRCASKTEAHDFAMRQVQMQREFDHETN